MEPAIAGMRDQYAVHQANIIELSFKLSCTLVCSALSSLGYIGKVLFNINYSVAVDYNPAESYSTTPSLVDATGCIDVVLFREQGLDPA